MLFNPPDKPLRKLRHGQPQSQSAHLREDQVSFKAVYTVGRADGLPGASGNHVAMDLPATGERISLAFPLFGNKIQLATIANSGCRR